MDRIKVSEGDCLIVTITGTDGVTSEYLDEIRNRFSAWAVKRGLNDVDYIFLGGKGRELDVKIKVISVNDIFENEVLRK